MNQKRKSSAKAQQSKQTDAGDLHSFIEQHQRDVAEAAALASLRQAHRHIASVLALLSDKLNAIDRSALVNTRALHEVVDYMVTWPDSAHRSREILIYDYAAEQNASVKKLVSQIEVVHDRLGKKGKALKNHVDEWRRGDVGGDVVVNAGRDYVREAYGSMAQKEQELFPAIDAAMSRQDWRELAADGLLQPLRDPVFGRRVSREFRTMARKLRRSLRRGVEHRAVAEWVGIESLFEAYEVLSMAAQSGRSVTRDQFLTGLRESSYIVLDAPLKAPLLCAANNARITLEWVEEIQEIYRDAAVDLVRVNRERQDRLRLLKRASRPG
ncbi:MAG: hemerythrin domain-containing protein [Pseudomonadota bacterium]